MLVWVLDWLDWLWGVIILREEEVDEILAVSSSCLGGVKKESSELSHGVLSLVEMHMCI